MGANTALFSVVDALLLRKLPVREPDRLVTVSSGFALGHGFKAGAGMNYDIWTRMRERALGTTSFEDGFAWAPVRVDLSDGGEVQPADALFASGGFFTTLGVPALLGRTFTPADDQQGGGPEGVVAVISYRVWQRRFNGAADVIGTALPVDGVRCTVIGVMPPAFFGIEVGQPFDVALPLAVEPIVRGARASLHNPSALMLTAMFRLAPGQSVDDGDGSAAHDAAGHSRALRRLAAAAAGDAEGPLRSRAGSVRHIRPVRPAAGLHQAAPDDPRRRRARPARGVREHREPADGARRGAPPRDERQAGARELALAARAAAAGGKSPARPGWARPPAWSSQSGRAGSWLRSLSTPDTRVTLDLSLDWRVLAATAAMAVLTAVLFGTGPAFRASRAAPIDALRDRGQGAASGARSGSLVVLQVALSLVLLVAAGSFVSTFRRLATLPLGFDAQRILVVDVDTARAHTDSASRLTYYQQLVDTVRPVPGVAQAAASTITPFNPATKSPLFADPARVHEQVVSPAFFATYGQVIRAGRDFDSRDSAQAPRVVIVSESYVRRFLAGRDPLAVTLESGTCDRRRGTCAIVGVVADAALGALRSGLRPSIYFPLAQSATLVAPGRTTIAVSLRSTSGSPALLASGVADALARFDRRLSFSYRPLEQDVTAALTQERLLAMLSSFFGGAGAAACRPSVSTA